jgi:tetratricopeptide (TPR) repeat protein
MEATTILNSLAWAHGQNKTFQEALKYLKASYEITPSAETLVNMTVAYKANWEMDKVLEYSLKALEINPNSKVYDTLIFCYQQLCDDKKVIEYIHKGLKYNPEDLNVLFHRAIYYMNKGQFKEGWIDWLSRESRRLHLSEMKKNFPTKPEWDGKSNPGKLLVIGEHGLGDQILFCRYLKGISKHTIFLTRNSLIRLFKKAKFDVKFLLDETCLMPEFDSWIGIESLPYVLNEPIRKVSGSYLPSKYQPRKIKNIGICWENKNPPEPYRGMEWNKFEPIIDHKRFKYTSLQFNKICPDSKIDSTQMLKSKDILDTSNIMDNLDLVITVDSVLAHLSAAKGIPTWVLRSKPYEWRFGETGQTPWYDNVKVYRQDIIKDWNKPINMVKKDLLDV